MLIKAENDLLDIVRGSPVKQRVRTIESMPDAKGDSLISRYGADAPAVYTVPRPARRAGDVFNVPFALLCVARNSASHKAGRQGDGKAIGLYELMDAVASVVETSGTWSVAGLDFLLDDEVLIDNGLYVGAVLVETMLELPAGIDPATLDDFATFRADYDVPPHESASEHQKWLDGDYGSSKPDASDTVTLDQ